MRNFKPFSLNIHGNLVEFTEPQVMGILNVTPDSFYASSRHLDADSIAKQAIGMLDNGVDIIDIGAYSSRPGAQEVCIDEELRRLKLGIETIRKNVSSDILISVDTFRSEVARIAVEEYGADIINDISGGTLDSEMFVTVKNLKVPYILMHMRGTPASMQTMTDYLDVTTDVITDIAKKISILNDIGVNDIIVDPGFGFAKTVPQNFRLLRHLDLIGQATKRPLLVGVSRKSMIYKSLDITPEKALNGTTIINTIALLQGASILRVHDVKEAREAVNLVNLTINS